MTIFVIFPLITEFPQVSRHVIMFFFKAQVRVQVKGIGGIHTRNSERDTRIGRGPMADSARFWKYTVNGNPLSGKHAAEN